MLMIHSNSNSIPIQDWLTDGCIVDLLSNQVLVGWGLSKIGQHDQIPEDTRGFVIDFFASQAEPQKLLGNFQVITKDQLRQRIEQELPETVKKNGLDWRFQEPQFAEFKSYFDEAQAHIAAQRAHKIVPVVAAIRESRPPSYLEKGYLLLNALSSTNAVYGFFRPDGFGCLGATPERLFVRESSGKIVAHAIAGTYQRDSGTSEAFLNDPKEVKEHNLVVENISEVLKQFGVVSQQPTEVLATQKLRHLKTELGLQPKTSLKVSELSLQLHPTPALGMSPRAENWRQILKAVSYKGRNYFGAPLGGITPEKDVFLVMIRGIEWNPERTYLPSGCGIVSASVLESEWQELLAKRQYTKELLGL